MNSVISDQESATRVAESADSSLALAQLESRREMNLFHPLNYELCDSVATHDFVGFGWVEVDQNDFKFVSIPGVD